MNNGLTACTATQAPGSIATGRPRPHACCENPLAKADIST